MKINQSGIAHLGAVLAIVFVLAIVGFAVWRVQNSATSTDEVTKHENNTSKVEETRPIEDISELRDVEAELEATDIDTELSTSELDEVIQ